MQRVSPFEKRREGKRREQISITSVHDKWMFQTKQFLAISMRALIWGRLTFIFSHQWIFRLLREKFDDLGDIKNAIKTWCVAWQNVFLSSIKRCLKPIYRQGCCIQRDVQFLTRWPDFYHFLLPFEMILQSDDLSQCSRNLFYAHFKEWKTWQKRYYEKPQYNRWYKIKCACV